MRTSHDTAKTVPRYEPCLFQQAAGALQLEEPRCGAWDTRTGYPVDRPVGVDSLSGFRQLQPEGGGEDEF
jgi:hypothetical protein